MGAISSKKEKLSKDKEGKTKKIEKEDLNPLVVPRFSAVEDPTKATPPSEFHNDVKVPVSYFSPKQHTMNPHAAWQTRLKCKGILLTGANGFVGRAMLFKLLIQTDDTLIFALVRGNAAGKLKEAIESDPYGLGLVRDKLDRVIPVSWDPKDERFGLSEEVWTELLSKTEVVIHTAATWVGEDLEEVNIGIPIRLRKIFMHIPFVFFSTVYVNVFKTKSHEETDQLTFDEKLYYFPGPDPEATKASFPNPYLYTKAHAEFELARITAEHAQHHEATVPKPQTGPLVILRTTGVTYAHRDPYPGWGKSTHGLQILLYLLGVGLLRIWRTNVHGNIVGIIPVDACIGVTYQAIIDLASGVLTPTITTPQGANIYVVHADTSEANPLVAQDMVGTAVKYFKDHALPLRKLEPSITFVTSDAVFDLRESLLAYRDKLVSETQISAVNKLVKQSWGALGTADLVFKTRYGSLMNRWEWNDAYFHPWFENLGVVLTRAEMSRIERQKSVSRLLDISSHTPINRDPSGSIHDDEKGAKREEGKGAKVEEKSGGGGGEKEEEKAGEGGSLSPPSEAVAGGAAGAAGAGAAGEVPAASSASSSSVVPSETPQATPPSS